MTVTATGQPKYQQGYEPLPAGFDYVPYGDLEALREAMDEDVCCVLLEPIQGEGGVRPLEPHFVKELEKPARDPRSEMPQPILRGDILEMKDLKEGMILKGTVRNVIDFGAFVDIGVHQDGLVHISQMTKRFIKHPLEAVSVGDIVEVKVISLDLAKKRIGLSMLLDK